MKKIYSYRTDRIILAISVIIGVGWGIIGERVYGNILGRIWTPILIGAYFTGLAVLLYLCISVGLVARGNSGNSIMLGIIFVFSVFAASMLFEIIYEIIPTKKAETNPTSYVFLIDDSGSMGQNDPNNLRNEAIYKVISECAPDFPFAVYSFTDRCNRIVPLTMAADAGNISCKFLSSGGTDVLNGLRIVVQDIESEQNQFGKAPKIILLSDGESSSRGLRRVLKETQRNNVSVSTIALGNADYQFLQRIADGTNGASIGIDNIDQLSFAMKDAAEEQSSSSRNLLSYRTFLRGDLLLGVLRIIFLLIIGLGFALLKLYLLPTVGVKNFALLSGVVLSIGGPLCIEIGINTFILNEALMRLIMCVCFSLTVSSYEAISFSSEESVLIDVNNDIGGNTRDFDTHMLEKQKQKKQTQMKSLMSNSKKHGMDDFDI